MGWAEARREEGERGKEEGRGREGVVGKLERYQYMRL